MKRTIALLIFMFLFKISLFAQQVLMIGPMIHVNFHDKKVRMSYALEASYWDVSGVPYGADLGLELERGKFRIYTEAQTGVGFAGISSGPFIEFNKGAATRGGLQSSVWVNNYIGADFRIRFYKGPNAIAPGIYGKLPLGSYGFDDEDDDDGSSFDGWD